MNKNISLFLLLGVLVSTSAQAGFLDKMSDIAQVATVANDVNNARKKDKFDTQKDNQQPAKQQVVVVDMENSRECRY